MTIRALMGLALPPLFLGMGLAMAATADLSLRAEAARASEEVGATTARSVAAFVDARVREGRAYDVPLGRLAGFGQILEVTVCDAGVASRREGCTPPPAAKERLDTGGAWVGSVESGPTGPVVRALAPLEGTGHVATVVSVASLVGRAAPVRRTFLRATAVFTLAGVLVALALGSLLSSGVRALEEGATALASGDATPGGGWAFARELSDLSLTFRTMRSILEGSLMRARGALLAHPVSDHLRACVLRPAALPEPDATVAGHRVTVHPVGDGGTGVFAGAAGGGCGGGAFAGTADGLDEPDRALEAAAVRVFLEARLSRDPDPVRAVRDVYARFQVVDLSWTTWADGTVRSRLLHTLTPEADRVLDALDAFHTDEDQAAAGAAMAGAVPDLGPGVVVLVRPAGPVPATPTEKP